jgi:hypothetical protein
LETVVATYHRLNQRLGAAPITAPSTFHCLLSPSLLSQLCVGTSEALSHLRFNSGVILDYLLFVSLEILEISLEILENGLEILEIRLEIPEDSLEYYKLV